MDTRVAVLASGEGTNLQALMDHPVVGPWVVLAVSDRAESGALRRATAKGVAAEFVDPASHPDRASFDRTLLHVLRHHDIEVVALAGFMRVLGSEFIEAFAGRILNVHPALLPSFPGAHAVRDALDWGVKVTGVTVHLVDEEVDHGPIVAQEAITVRDDDDWDTLEPRVHQVEHRLFSAAIRALVEGRLKVEGRRVHVLAEPEP